MTELFITGTDTGVGKTTVACALVAAARARGLRTQAMKPVETGCRRDAAGTLQPADGLALDRALRAPLARRDSTRHDVTAEPSGGGRQAGGVEPPRAIRDDSPAATGRAGPDTRAERVRAARRASPAHFDPTAQGEPAPGSERAARDDRRAGPDRRAGRDHAAPDRLDRGAGRDHAAPDRLDRRAGRDHAAPDRLDRRAGRDDAALDRLDRGAGRDHAAPDRLDRGVSPGAIGDAARRDSPPLADLERGDVAPLDVARQSSEAFAGALAALEVEPAAWQRWHESRGPVRTSGERGPDTGPPPGPAVPRSTVYRFAAPLAPAIAAELEGRTVALAPILRAADRLRSLAPDLFLVEGAGGLLVPLTQALDMADLAAALAMPLLVIARDSLGTINHTLLTLEAAAARGLRVAGVVLSAAVPGTSERDAARNATEIERRGAVPVLGRLPHLADTSPATLAKAAETALDLDRLFSPRS